MLEKDFTVNFVKSDDEETIEKLKALGLTLLAYENGMATFLNDSKVNFDSSMKVVYTNILTF